MLFYFSLFKAPSAVLKLLESVSRRFFWGHGEGEKKMHWISWSQIQKPLSEGGLGVVNFKLKNEALLAKWIWRFVSQQDAIWKDVITEFYGRDGGMFLSRPLAEKSLWATIVNCCNDVKVQNQSLLASFRKILANGSQASFWMDREAGQGTTLKDLFPSFSLWRPIKTFVLKIDGALITGHGEELGSGERK